MLILFRHPRLIVNAVRHWRIFVLGWREAHSGFGLTFDGDPYSPRSEAYDTGRNLRLRGRA